MDGRCVCWVKHAELQPENQDETDVVVTNEGGEVFILKHSLGHLTCT